MDSHRSEAARADAASADTASVDANVWSTASYGQPCSPDAGGQCPQGYCGELYAGQGPTCFKRCDGTGECADFPITPFNNGAVNCGTLSGIPVAVCYLGSNNLGPCGNRNNAGCLSGDGCITDQPGSGWCGRACNPADPLNAGACRTPTTTCGCSGGQSCSTSPVSFASGVPGQPDGICVAAHDAGAQCGIDPATRALVGCNAGEVCPVASWPSATCALPVDGGSDAARHDQG